MSSSIFCWAERGVTHEKTHKIYVSIRPHRHLLYTNGFDYTYTSVHGRVYGASTRGFPEVPTAK